MLTAGGWTPKIGYLRGRPTGRGAGWLGSTVFSGCPWVCLSPASGFSFGGRPRFG